jgi:hypothetical protein
LPRFLEEKLKKEYPNNPAAVYGTLNRLGYMRGSKETAAGKAAQAKHDRDMSHGRVHPGKNLGAHLHPRKSR